MRIGRLNDVHFDSPAKTAIRIGWDVSQAWVPGEEIYLLLRDLELDDREAYTAIRARAARSRSEEQ